MRLQLADGERPHCTPEPLTAEQLQQTAETTTVSDFAPIRIFFLQISWGQNRDHFVNDPVGDLPVLARFPGPPRGV
jgi:hypothetical protein